MSAVCQRCGQPVLIGETLLGHLATFDPDPVPGHEGGAWRLDGERMRRVGAGPRPLYRVHDRSCTDVVTADLIPLDRDFKMSKLPSWRMRTRHEGDEEE